MINYCLHAVSVWDSQSYIDLHISIKKINKNKIKIPKKYKIQNPKKKSPAARSPFRAAPLVCHRYHYYYYSHAFFFSLQSIFFAGFFVIRPGEGEFLGKPPVPRVAIATAPRLRCRPSTVSARLLVGLEPSVSLSPSRSTGPPTFLSAGRRVGDVRRAGRRLRRGSGRGGGARRGGVEYGGNTARY